MGRFALIKADGIVDNVIVADADFATELAGRLGYLAREVVTELEQPTTADAITTRRCEPGARLVERAATASEKAAGRARRKAGSHVTDDFEPAPIAPDGSQ